MNRKQLEIGKRFGSLQCIEKISEGDFAGPEWKCRCKCGQEITVSEALLICGVVRSCGCKAGRAMNLQGKRFGFLTALAPVSERGSDNSICWLCRCDCGNYKVISSNKLNMGRYTSCDCRKTEASKEGKNFIDGTCVEIMLSGKIPSNNTSGYRGVAKKRNKWQAYICYAGRMKHLGTFATKEEAAEARCKAEEEIRRHLEQLMEARQESACERITADD